jgi:hypothetical protein
MESIVYDCPSKYRDVIVSPTRSIGRYNKGEWAELYVLARVLCDGVLHVGKHGAAAQSRTLNVVHVQRASRPGSSLVEVFDVTGLDVLCVHTGKRVLRTEICPLVPRLLKQIRAGKGAFASSVGQQLLDLLDLEQLKSAGEKSDVFIDVVDPLTGASGLQGYTIKAFLGSTPTLLNASGSTNVRYDIRPGVGSADVAAIAKLKVRQRFQRLRELGLSLAQSDMNPVFRSNLTMLDASMPELVGQLLLAYYSMPRGSDAGVSAIVDRVADANPFGVPNPGDYYRHKAKDLLEAVAYGMVPASPWAGTHSAAGGLIIVEKSGELVCIPQGGRNEHRDYLLAATKFDTPSTTRHGFGSIEHDQSGQYVKANLQIRYK